MAERGILVSYATVVSKIRAGARTGGETPGGPTGDTWYLDEVFVTIKGRRHYLWRAVVQDGNTLDILLQSRRNQRAAEQFFPKLLEGEGTSPREPVTDKLSSFAAARRTTTPSVPHLTARGADNRAEVSHQPTRVRERQMGGRLRAFATWREVTCVYETRTQFINGERLPLGR